MKGIPRRAGFWFKVRYLDWGGGSGERSGPGNPRCGALAAWLQDWFGIWLGVTTVGQELRRMGYAKLSARPRHHA